MSWGVGRKGPFRKIRDIVSDVFLPSNPTVSYSGVLSPSSLKNVVSDDLVSVDFQLVFKLAVQQDSRVFSWVGSKIDHQMQFTSLLGAQHWTVQTTVGCVIKYEHGAPLALVPSFLSERCCLFLCIEPLTLAGTYSNLSGLCCPHGAGIPGFHRGTLLLLQTA